MRKSYTRCPTCGNWTFDKDRDRCERTECDVAMTVRSDSRLRNAVRGQSAATRDISARVKGLASGGTGDFSSTRLIQIKDSINRTAFGAVMISVWVLLWFVFQFAPFETILPYSLGWHGGFLPLQLLTYSFFHLEGVDLLCNIVTLAGVIHISRTCLSGAGFFRAYSLGVLGSGFIYLWLLWLFGEQARGSVIIGGTPAIVAMLVTLTVLRPRMETSLLGDSFRENAGKYIVLMIVVGLAIRFYGMVHLEEEREYIIHTFFDQLLMTNFIRYFIIIPLLLTHETTLARISIWLVLPDLVMGIIGLTVFGFDYGSFWWNPSRFFTFVAAILMGLIYGSVERITRIFVTAAEKPEMEAQPLEVSAREAESELLRVVNNSSSIDQLITALKDRELSLRVAAAETLGNRADTRAVDPLIAALKDRDFNVRSAAAVALGKIGDARAMSPLNAALGDWDRRVRKAAAEALKKLGKMP